MRLIPFYQNLSYCRTCKKDHCDHDDKPLGFWHGRARLFAYDFIAVEWNVGRHNSLCAEVEWLGGESNRDLKLRIGLPFLFTFYLTIVGFWGKMFAEPWKIGPRSAGVHWNDCGQFLKINLGGKVHESSCKDPWWAKGFSFTAPWDMWHLRTEILAQSANNPTGFNVMWQEDCRTYWHSCWDRLVRNGKPSRTEHGIYSERENAQRLTAIKFPYRYVLKSGEVQNRTATCHIVRHTWGRRWFPFLQRSETAVSVDFDGEVGEGTGSWKGGTTGCGYTMLPGETVEQTLRRMERERKFDR